MAAARFLLRQARRIVLLGVFAALLLGSNVALLAFDGIYDAARHALVSLLPDGRLRPRPSRQAMQAEMDGLRAERAKLGDDVASLERRNAGLASERGRLAGELDELGSRNAGLRGEVDALRGRNARLAGEADGLRTRNADLTVETDGLRGRNAVLSGRIDADAATRREAATVARRVVRRTQTATLRNFGGMAAESIPYVGAAAVVGLTFVEVRDACDSMRDMRTLEAMFDGTTSDELPTCGYTLAEFWQAVRRGEDQLDCREVAALTPEAALECTGTRMPWEAEGVPAPAPAPERITMPWE